MNRWQWRTVFVVGVGLTGWLFHLIGAGAFQQVAWPPIGDPAAIRREAETLCRGEGGWRELPPAQYPPAITRLHPASISVSGERVYLGLVPVSGGARFHGYYVWPTGVDRPGGGIEREEADTPQATSNQR